MGPNVDMMNATPRVASAWCGRILCSLDWKKSKKPKAKVKPIEDEEGKPRIGDEMRRRFGDIKGGHNMAKYLEYELRV